MTNRAEQRLIDFNMLRKQVEQLSSEEIQERLANKTFGFGQASIARQILRERVDNEPQLSAFKGH